MILLFACFNQTQNDPVERRRSEQSKKKREMRNAFEENLTCAAKEKKHQDYLLGQKHCHHSDFLHAAKTK